MSFVVEGFWVFLHLRSSAKSAANGFCFSDHRITDHGDHSIPLPSAHKRLPPESAHGLNLFDLACFFHPL